MTARALFRRNEALILGVAGLLAFVFLWEIAARFEWVNPALLASPTSVVQALDRWLAGGRLWRDLWTSLWELGISFAASVLIGVPLGVLMGWFRRVEYALDPFVWVLYSAPSIAFWPLLMIWLGMGTKPIIALSFILAFVTVTINTMAGVREIDPVLIKCARSFNARPWDLFAKFMLPAAMPMITAGLRLALGRALIGVIIGELFSSNAGLGFHISYFGARLRFADVFASIVLVVLVGVLLTQAIRVVENRMARWRE